MKFLKLILNFLKLSRDQKTTEKVKEFSDLKLGDILYLNISSKIYTMKYISKEEVFQEKLLAYICEPIDIDCYPAFPSTSKFIVFTLYDTQNSLSRIKTKEFFNNQKLDISTNSKLFNPIELIPTTVYI